MAANQNTCVFWTADNSAWQEHPAGFIRKASICRCQQATETGRAVLKLPSKRSTRAAGFSVP
jgi:hypothetical protein